MHVRMRLAFLSSIYLALSVVAVFSQTNPIHRHSFNNYPASVSEVRVEEAKIEVIDVKLVEGRRILKRLYSFSGDGKREEARFFKPDGTLMAKEVRLLDDSGRLIESSLYSGEDKMKSRYMLIYNSDGILIEQDFYGADGALRSRNVISRQRADKDETVLSQIYKSDGTYEGSSSFTHEPTQNHGGVKYEGSITNADTMLSKRIVVQFDGKTREEQHYNPDGSLETKSITITTQNETGKVVEFSVYKADGTLTIRMKEEYESDSAGNTTKVIRSRWDAKTQSWIPTSVQYFAIKYKEN